jgi:ribosomal protein S18 acetylase RimI-like enzyme
MRVRAFRSEDAPDVAALSAACARGETDFVLNPLWESAEDLFAEFARHGIAPEEHLLVAEGDAAPVVGVVGFVRRPGSTAAGLLVPIVERAQRGRGVGGELLRAALAQGQTGLGIKLVSAAIGSRNHAGYALLTGFGFRPARQHFLMRLDAAPKPAPPPLPGLVFAPAAPADAPAILAIYEACGFEARDASDMANVLADPRRAVAVARLAGDGDRVVAFAELETHWPARIWVAFVGVEGELRDRGVGSALVTWAVGRQFEGAAKTALLLLSPANRTALRAYEKAGFRRHRMIDVLQKGL